MPTCGDIVNRALRKLGRLGAGRDAHPNDAQDCLEALKGLYRAWITSGAFGRLADVVPNSDYVAGENQRIFRNSDATGTITFPELAPAYAEPRHYPEERASYTNYEGVDGNNRPPRDGTVVEVVDSTTGLAATYIYDGQLRDWQAIDSLLLTSGAPRSARDPEGLAACLAAEIADMFGADVPPSTLRACQRYEQAMVTSYSNPRQAAVAEYM